MTKAAIRLVRESRRLRFVELLHDGRKDTVMSERNRQLAHSIADGLDMIAGALRMWAGDDSTEARTPSAPLSNPPHPGDAEASSSIQTVPPMAPPPPPLDIPKSSPRPHGLKVRQPPNALAVHDAAKRIDIPIGELQRRMRSGDVPWVWVGLERMILLEDYDLPPGVHEALLEAGRSIDEWRCMFRKCRLGRGSEMIYVDKERFWDLLQAAPDLLLRVAAGDAEGFREQLLDMRYQLYVARLEEWGEIPEGLVPTSPWGANGWSRAVDTLLAASGTGKLSLDEIYSQMLAIFGVHDPRGESKGYTVKEAAAELGISVSEMNRLLRSGQVEFSKVGSEEDSSPRQVSAGALRRYLSTVL